MPSKQVVDRQKSAEAVIAAAETHAERVGTAAEEKLAPFLKGKQPAPNIKALIALASASLASTKKTMVEADEAHVQELGDDDAPRENRDAAQQALSTELVELREWMTGLFGGAAVRKLGFSDQAPRDAVALSRFAGEVVTALKTKPLPAPRKKGVKWDADESIETLTKLRTSLDGFIADVAREAREAQGTLVTKNNAIAAYDESFREVANLLVGLFEFAGERELADRVRPSTRRPGQREADAPQVEDAPAKNEPGGG